MGADTPTKPPPPARLPVAKVGVRAPPLPREEPSPFEEDRFAEELLAKVEERLFARMEELNDRQSHVHVEIARPSSVAPKDKQHWVWRLLGIISAGLAGAAALVGACAALYAQLRREPPDYSKQFKAIAVFEESVSTHLDEQDAWNHAERNYVNGLFADQGVKIVPAPGEPPHQPVELLPAPLVNPHKITRTPRLQPRAPAPMPPAPFVKPPAAP